MLALTFPLFEASTLMAPSAKMFALAPTLTFTVCAWSLPTWDSMLPPPKEASETLVLDALSEKEFVSPLEVTLIVPLALSVNGFPVPRPATVLSPVLLWAKTPCALTALTVSGLSATAFASVFV